MLTILQVQVHSCCSMGCISRRSFAMAFFRSVWPFMTVLGKRVQDSLLEQGCVALLAEQLGAADVDMRVAAAWTLANLAYRASDAARMTLLAQLPSAKVVTALHDQHSAVQARFSCPVAPSCAMAAAQVADSRSMSAATIHLTSIMKRTVADRSA